MTDWIIDDGANASSLSLFAFIPDDAGGLPDPGPLMPATATDKGDALNDPLYGWGHGNEDDPPPTTVGEVVVTGVRPSEPVWLLDVDIGLPDIPLVPDINWITDLGDDLSQPEEPPCSTTREALDIQSEINNNPESNDTEFGAITYNDNGTIRRSEVFRGDGNGHFNPTELFRWMAENGIEFSQVTGFIHNHDEAHYGGNEFTRNINRYPSDADWSSARQFVELGADPNLFSMFVISPRGVMHDFDFANSNIYEGMRNYQKNGGIGLPDEIGPEDLCGESNGAT